MEKIFFGKFYVVLFSHFFPFEKKKCLFSDIDECVNKTHICDSNAICNNIPGGYECECNTGYDGNGNECAGKL